MFDYPTRRQVLTGTAGIAAAALTGCGSGAGDGVPSVIAIGAPAVAGTQQSIMGAQGIARVKGWLAEEFRGEGISFAFPGFRGGAASVNQALANGQIDFAYAGDLVAIIGHAAGVGTRLIMPCGRLENAYLAVRPDSSIRSIEDLRGRKVAYFKGSYLHLQVVKILAGHGLAEQDLESVNLDYATAAAALANGDVEAVFTGIEALGLRDRGIARLAYSTQGKDPRLTGQAGVLVRDDFARRHPGIVRRMVNVWTKAADWSSDPAHQDEVLRAWATGKRTVEQLRANYGDVPLRVRLSPLLDPFLRSQFGETQRLAQQLGLLRGKPFDIDHWFDDQYLESALKSLSLQDRWVALNPLGRPA